MAKYQIHLIVDIEAKDGDDAYDTAERLGDFLGLHHLTATAGTVLEVLEVDETVEDEEEALVDPDAELNAEPESFDVESLVETAHAMSDNGFVHQD